MRGVSVSSEFQFVDELPGLPFKSVRSPNRTLRPEAQQMLRFADALRERPMTWAVWPRPLTTTSGTTASRQRDGFYRQLLPYDGFESSSRDGVLYVRYNPDSDTDGRSLAFREGYAAGHKRGVNDLSGIVERAFVQAREDIRQLKEDVQ